MRSKNERFKNVTSIPLYFTWQQMIARCYHPHRPNYHLYGGRGIRVCEFFRAGPQNIIAVMGERPAGMLIDRKDNDGHYSCGSCAECGKCGWSLNVRWATPKDQSLNRRNNRQVTINGETHPLVVWASKIGITPEALSGRIKRGSDLLQPRVFGKQSRRVTINGETHTIKEWASKVGTTPSNFNQRLRSGLDPLQPIDIKQQRNSLCRQR